VWKTLITTLHYRISYFALLIECYNALESLTEFYIPCRISHSVLLNECCNRIESLTEF